jgi:hypothetical protein
MTTSAHDEQIGLEIACKIHDVAERAASRHPAGHARIARIAGQIGRTTYARSFTSIISAMP